MRHIITFKNLNALQDSSTLRQLDYFVVKIFECHYESCSNPSNKLFKLDCFGSIIALESRHCLSQILEALLFDPKFIKKTIDIVNSIYRIGYSFDNDLIAQNIIGAKWQDVSERLLLEQNQLQGGNFNE